MPRVWRHVRGVHSPGSVHCGRSWSLTTARSISSPEQKFHIHFTGMAKSVCFFLQGALHSRAIAIHSEETGPGIYPSPPGSLEFDYLI